MENTGQESQVQETPVLHGYVKFSYKENMQQLYITFMSNDSVNPKSFVFSMELPQPDLKCLLSLR